MNPPSSSTADYRALSTAISASPTPYPADALQPTPLRPASSLVFIDSAVADAQFLAANVTAGSEVHFLDPAQNAIAQITNTLLGRENIASVQVLSHGAAGGLQLGQDWLNLATVQSYATQLQSWQNALTDDADILLYGCNVAQGEVGKAFVQILGQLTGADVAASENLTGNSALGGDWTLEYQFGSIEAAQAFLQPAEAAYQGVLATFFVINTNDSGLGSLRQAILDANALVGADIIDFQIPGTGVQTINLASALPTLTGQVIIDGYSQTGATQNTLAVGNNANLRIVLNGSGAGSSVNGITLSSVAAGSTIQGLVIQNFQGSGIVISGGSNGNTIAGNFIGTDATGTIDQGNAQQGIILNASNNVIGGTTAAARNVISGNNGVGIVFLSGSNTVQGNYIGTNAAGTQDLGNSFDGLQIQAGNNLIGGSAAGAGNVIAGNDRTGILLAGTSTSGNQIQGNFIGTDSSGTLSLGNSSSGIWLQGGASSNTIGGTATGAGNVIAFNTGLGVVLLPDAGVNNSILGNRLFSNTGLGIDLGGNGITANDVGDADTGTNNLQNFPVLTSVSSTTIQGSLNSIANTSFRIEFFANTTTDNEGEVYLGFQNVTTDASGNAVITYSYTAVAGKPYITATATNLTTGDTSEFSLVNQAPSLTADATLAAILEDATSISGATITSLFTGRFSDPNSGSSLSGLAIVGNLANASTQGTWQYSTDGTNWFAIGAVGDDATALALSAATRLRFVPVANYNGTPPSLTVRAIDNTYSSFTNGATRVTLDASINGGQNAISAITRVIGTSVTAVNDQPSFTAGSNQSAVAGSGAQTVANWATGFDAGPADEDATQSVLSYEIVSNDNPTLFATGGTPTIAADGTLTYTPGTTAGTATIQVRVRDTGGTANGGSDTSTIQTFTITINPQTVTLTAPDATAAEGGIDNGTFRISRGTVTGGNLVVNLTIDGSSTASASDYTLSGGSVTISGTTLTVTIPDGQSFVDVNLAAIAEAVGFAEGNDTLRLNLATGSYTIGASSNATVTISQNGFVVINTNDSGEGSLRQAILNANAIAGTDTITFAGATFTDATPDTITLTSGQLGISTNVTITGTGANLLTVSGNNASRLFNIASGTVAIDGLTITNGNANGGNGGGILNSGNLSLTNSLVRNNTALFGGGIHNLGGTATVLNSIISDNTATEGGGINNNNFSTLILTNSTISGNRSTNNGGGIMNISNTSVMTITNSTISGNTGANGGGIRSTTNATLTLTNVTIANNTATSGGGGLSYGSGTVNVKNTLIANNTHAISPDVAGTFVSQGNNLIGKSNGSSGFINGTNADIVGTIAAPIDPQLGALANNGGPTQTHALLNGSLAINAGSNTGVTATDQTGNPRIVNGLVDIGAVESPFDRVSLTAQDATATEFSVNPGVYRIQRGGSVGNLVVNLSIAGTSTASASDYTFSSNVTVSGSTLTVTIPDGQNFVDITLTPVLDAIVEGTETLTLNLASGNYGINPAQTAASVNILDAPVLSIAATDATATEGPGDPGIFRISRTTTTGDLQVNLTIDGSSTASASDYTLSGGSITVSGSNVQVTIPDGQSFVDVNLAAIAEAVGFAEGNDTLRLNLAAGSYAIGASSNATVTITQNGFVVINTNDSGEGSLRQAILNANAIAGADTITFAGATFTDAIPDTITLTSGELGISSDVTITGTGANLLTVSGNNASRVFSIASGTVAIDGLTIANGSANGGQGGGIYNAGTLGISNSTIRNSSASGGGGIYNTGSLTINNSTVSSNTATSRGAGIRNESIGSTATLTITNSTISGNALTSSGFAGGGIDNFANLGTATIFLSNSTVSGNTSQRYTGGISNNGTGSQITLINSTIADNTATIDFGGIWNGGGGFSGGGTVTATNTIIANNTSSTIQDFSGSLTATNSLIGNSSGATITGTGNILNQAALLGALANNGGSTQTHALLAGSPAINTGSNTGVSTTDQTGNARIVNNVVDMGAVESPFARLSLTATDATATELPGNTGTYRIQRDGTVGDLVVNLTIANSSTASAADYTFSNNVSVSGSILTVTIPDGQNFVDMTLTPVLDAIVEGTETLTLNLTAGSYGINPAQTTASVNIIDAPVLSITATDATATELPGNPGTFRITRTGDTSQALVVNYTVSGTATNGTDYTPLNGTVTILAGQTFIDVQVDPIADTVVESSETVVMTLATGNYAISATDTATVNILDAPVLSITTTDATATELPGNPGTLRITRTGDTTQALTVNYTVGGTATSGSDYTTLTGTATIAVGQSFVDVTLAPVNDNLIEGTETVVLTLAAGEYVVSATNTATVDIIDAPIVTVAVPDASASESAPNSGSFRITCTGDTSQALTVNYTIAGTATNGSDYATLTGTTTILAGQTFVDVLVNPINDTIAEGDETIQLNLTTGDYNLGSTTSGTVTLLANDPTIRITPVTVSQSEGDNGSSNSTFTVELSNPSDEVVTVNYATVDGTATTADNDYTANSGTLTFNPGVTRQTITIAVNGDTTFEADETFQVALSAATNGTLSTTAQTATGVIGNDDAIPVYTFSTANYRTLEGNGLNIIPLAITRSGNLSQAASVQVQLSNGSAIAGRDFVGGVITVSFAVGQSVAYLPVQILGNRRSESNKTLNLSLVGLSEAGRYGDQAHSSLTIVNDDPTSRKIFHRGKGRSGIKSKTSKHRKLKRRK
ncbi:DUF4347 domain-containing protein [Pantanalinema sp. GBBB05]|uniref:DUF4347 domain-containing protein n=1 Tax=Pantanalinema sp. GBBB05 TaxID=2604139 RepID=UPI001DE47993|nr:DUF4347 domain-containing protein [Pantanalinema sp. GBBB05]